MKTSLIYFLIHFRNNALWPTLLVIIVIELFAHPYLFNRYFSHEVDKLLYTLKTKRFDAPVIVIGDSVGHGIFSGWDYTRGKIFNLACNQATETVGQYFFIKRYVEKNNTPRAVISCDRTPLQGNLGQNLTENYIQRCFTYWSEIMEIAFVKLDPAFTTKMIAYKLLSTYKYRLHLQKELIGSSNSNIYSGISLSGTPAKPAKGIFYLLKRSVDQSRQASVSEHFFKKIAVMLEKESIPLFYLPPPSRIDNEDTNSLIKQSLEKLSELQKTHLNIQLLDDRYQRLSNEYFGDDVHLNEAGLNFYRPSLLASLERIVSTSLVSRRDDFLKRFQQGLSLYSLGNDQLISQLSALHDVTVHLENQMIKMYATGVDPALLFPPVTAFTTRKNVRAVAFFKLESEKKTTARLYYKTSFKNNFSEEKSLRQRVFPGTNWLFFVLPKEFGGGSIRFDPGDAQGMYMLHEFQMKLVTLGSSYQKINDLFPPFPYAVGEK